MLLFIKIWCIVKMRKNNRQFTDLSVYIFFPVRTTLNQKELQMSAKPTEEKAFSMPRTAPLYMAPPYYYQGNRTISILFRTTPEILRELVPAPLVANPDGLIFVYISQFNIVAPQPFAYQEAGIGVPVSFSRTAGQYAVYLYLDEADAIVAGREIYGFPKKGAQLLFNEGNELVTAQVARAGAVLIEAAVSRSERIDPPPQEPAVPWFNLKLIPSVKQDAPPEVMQLTSTLVEGETRELYGGPAELKLASGPLDPLGDIPIVEIVQGRYVIDDFTLGYGEVIHDYLAEGQRRAALILD
jgi:acetoacetate decarboxylase